MSRAAAHARATTDPYLDLVREFPLRPIRNKAEYRHARRVMEGLAVRNEGSLEPGEQDYLDMLSLVIEQYDRANRPKVGRTDAIGVLKFLMEENRMNVTALGDLIGSKSLASSILSGRRGLSKAVIAKLARRFSVDASVFLPGV